MQLECKLPDLGYNSRDGEIVRWLVAEGDTVTERQGVVEVITDIVTVEIPTPSAGKIVKLRARAGEIVPVGDVIFTIETEPTAAH